MSDTAPPIRHPAKFSDPILAVVATLVDPAWRILDPFAGIGRVHELGPHTVGVEIEPEWAAAHPRTVCANALALPFDAHSFDAIVTSPTYGNRMADHHNARDDSRRITYRHTLGRPLHPANSGRMQWGEEYRALHRAAWAEATRVLVPGGRFVLNVSNHIRGGVEVHVVGWHLATLRALDYRLEFIQRVPTKRMRQGANGAARVDGEMVVVLRRAEVWNGDGT